MEQYLIEGGGETVAQRLSSGILAVKARNHPDLYRGLGFAHGTDRALQMSMLRILGQGRASELLVSDERMLGIDRFFRRLGFARGVESEWSKLDAGEQALVRAYCEGVNQAFARKFPWELKLLGYRPEPWRPEDSLMLSRVVAYVGLAQTQGEMERLLIELIQAGVAPEALEELYPGRLLGLDVELLRQVKLEERVVPDAVRWLVGLPRFVASNNWVISGAKTKSGKPILANDPHLEVNGLPAAWYECQLELPDRYMMGAGMAGMPAILIGRNADLSWGVTYSFMDAIDSWVERVEGGKYLRVENGREAWRPFKLRRETIKRKKKHDFAFDVYENEHGILDGDPGPGGHLLATKWATADQSGAASVKAMLAMLDARTVEEGRRLLGSIESAWNWVLADTKGTIGYQMSGKMPLRREGVRGLVALPGWDPANDWQGFAPLEDLPRILNPASGFFVTANHDLNPHGKRQPISCPMASWRADRIADALASRDDWTVEGVRQLQTDLYSRQADVYLRILLPLIGDEAEARILKDWDRCYDAGSRGAALFEAFFHALLEVLVGGAVGPAVYAHLRSETAVFPDFFEAFERLLLAEKSLWFKGKTRAQVFVDAWEIARKQPPRAWGETQTITMAHMLFGGKLPGFFGFDKGPLALPGGRATVQQGQVFRSGNRVTSFGPSYRFVADMAEKTAHTVLAGGTSDRRFSKHYLSDFARWRAGKLKVIGPGTGE